MPAITALTVSPLTAQFTLTPGAVTKSSDFVTISEYAASGVTVTINAAGTMKTLTGDIVLVTEVMKDASGNGVVRGHMELVTGTGPALMAQLDGMIGEVSTPIKVQGFLPPADAPIRAERPRKPPVQVAGILAVNGTTASLTGYVVEATMAAR